MGSVTGIELGPASCVLVAARPGAAGADVSAVHVIEPHEWPEGEPALGQVLKAARRTRKLPRHARAVLWSLEQPASIEDPEVRRAIRPLVAAGFRIDAVMTPAEALAAVASARPREGAVAWLSLNTHGGALIVMLARQILLSRTFTWAYNPEPLSVREQLLQRYSIVSHIAPELRRAMAIVHAEHRVTLDTAVTCGDLPDLRSLTMPLIEELGIEVETLDSPERLRLVGATAGATVSEHAPVIRLACAAALMPVPRRRAVMPLGAAAVVLIGIGLTGFAAWNRSPVRAIEARVEPQNPPPAAAPVEIPRPVPVTVIAEAAAPKVSEPAVTVAETAPALPPAVPDVPTKGATPAAEPKPAPAAAPVPAVPQPRVQEPPVRDIPPIVQEPVDIAPPPRVAAPVRQSARHAGDPEKPRAAARKPRTPLPPVPAVTTILIGRGRRLAMINGSIVGVGDSVGPRVIVAIEETAVVLRDEWGTEVRAPLRVSLPDEIKSTPPAPRSRGTAPAN